MALLSAGAVPENDGIYVGRAPSVPFPAARAVCARLALEGQGGKGADSGAAMAWRMAHVGNPIAVEHTRVVAVGAEGAPRAAAGAGDGSFVITRPALGAASGADLREPCTLVVSIDTVRFLDHPLFSREDYLASSLASLFTEYSALLKARHACARVPASTQHVLTHTHTRALHATPSHARARGGGGGWANGGGGGCVPRRRTRSAAAPPRWTGCWRLRRGTTPATAPRVRWRWRVCSRSSSTRSRCVRVCVCLYAFVCVFVCVRCVLSVYVRL